MSLCLQQTLASKQDHIHCSHFAICGSSECKHDFFAPFTAVVYLSLYCVLSLVYLTMFAAQYITKLLVVSTNMISLYHLQHWSVYFSICCFSYWYGIIAWLEHVYCSTNQLVVNTNMISLLQCQHPMSISLSRHAALSGNMSTLW